MIAQHEKSGRPEKTRRDESHVAAGRRKKVAHLEDRLEDEGRKRKENELRNHSLPDSRN